MRRVLIITYYWPPSAGSGVQRWLKFAKYLPEYDWQPVIYTPENPDFDLKDKSLLKDVSSKAEIIKQPIWEPYKYASLFQGGKNGNSGANHKVIPNKKESFLAKIPKWIRGNIFLPDPRVFWVKPSVKYLKKYLLKNPVEVIISTGPPHSMHLVANALKLHFNLPWIADFRDPFAQTDAYDTYYLTQSSRRKLVAMEKMILDNCDVLLSTSYSVDELLEDFDTRKMKTLTNGFDTSDYQQKGDIDPNKYLIFHAGTLGNVRNPSSLWKVLVNWSKERPKLYDKIEVTLAGSVSEDIKSEVYQTPALKEKVQFLGYLSHEAIFELYNRASLLLLAVHSTRIGKVCIPGKLFEYLGTKKNILAFGDPMSDAAKVINDTNAGFCLAYDDFENTEKALLQLMTNRERLPIKTTDIEQFSRFNLTGELTKLLNTISILETA